MSSCLTGLYEAAITGDTARVEGLMRAGHHPDTHKDVYNTTSLHAAADKGHIECLRLLMQAKGSLTSTDDFGRTPLHIAIKKNHFSAAKLIIEHPEGKTCLRMGCGPDKKTPLALALDNGNASMIKLMEEAGATLTVLTIGKCVLYIVLQDVSVK